MSDTPYPNCGYCPTCGHRRGDITILPPVIIQPAPTPTVVPWTPSAPYVGTPYPFPGGSVTISYDSGDGSPIMNAMSSIVSSVVDSLSRPLMFNRVAA